MITLGELGLDAIGDVLLDLHVVGSGREPDLGMAVWNMAEQLLHVEEEKQQEELIMLIYYTVLEVPDTVRPDADGIQDSVSERGLLVHKYYLTHFGTGTGPRTENILIKRLWNKSEF